MTGPASRPEFLDGPNPPSLLIFGGKGGVGKTTCAAATALHLALLHPGERFLLMSTDPAHSVADCLRGDGGLPPNLDVCELDAPAEHERFMAQHGATLAEIGRRGTFLDGGDVDRFLRLSLPGLDELMALLSIATLAESRQYRTLIVDTAPTGHALRLLQMPELLRSWLGAMDAMLGKHRWMASVFSPGRTGGKQAAAKADPCEDFLDHLTEVFTLVEAILRDPARCRFVPVMLAEALSVAETCDLVAELSALSIAAPELVINRLIPAEATDTVLGPARAEQSRVLGTLPPALASGQLWALPLLGREPVGSAQLEAMWAKLGRWRDVLGDTTKPAPAAAPAVDGVLALPGAACRLVILAGKGGVGKTTMAAATALRLAAAHPSGRTLVVSTDPAHSLGDALAPAVVALVGGGGPDGTGGAQPSPLAPGLWAMELDARADFAALVDAYRDELEVMLEAAMPAGDMAFDREALERIIDLAPPGLDEVMAVAKVVELLGNDGSPDPRARRRGASAAAHSPAPPAPTTAPFDRVVIDAAPTGHLLRLLHLPEVIEDWLRAIFDVLLKHRSLFKMPRLEARLVELSRGVKRLRALLADPQRCQLVAVTIPTQMALDETGDLVEACRHAGVPVGGLIINQVTRPATHAGDSIGSPAAGDSLATLVARREALLVERLASSFPALRQAVVSRGHPPRGVAALTTLGHALFTAAEPAPVELAA